MAGLVLQSSDGEIIPPEYLSTGAKTAICVYEFPDEVFNATQMGDNALYFALKIAIKHDITLLTYHDIPLCWLQELELQKDYENIDISGMDSADFYDMYDEWLEEGLKDGRD